VVDEDVFVDACLFIGTDLREGGNSVGLGHLCVQDSSCQGECNQWQQLVHEAPALQGEESMRAMFAMRAMVCQVRFQKQHKIGLMVQQ
jgi:hypothetical protein